MNFFARNQIRNSVSQETKLKTVKHQKNNRLFHRNNRLFIPVKITTTEIKEFKEDRDAQTVYTGSLLNQELHPISQKPLENLLGNQNQITYTHTTKEVTLIPSRNTLPLAQHTHTKNVDLDNLKSTKPSWLYNTRMYKVLRTNYTVTKSTEINTE